MIKNLSPLALLCLTLIGCTGYYSLPQSDHTTHPADEPVAPPASRSKENLAQVIEALWQAMDQRSPSGLGLSVAMPSEAMLIAPRGYPQANHSIELRWTPTGHDREAAVIVSIMKPGYDSHAIIGSAERAELIAAWKGRRVYFWSDEEHWPTAKEDILAALREVSDPDAEQAWHAERMPWLVTVQTWSDGRVKFETAWWTIREVGQTPRDNEADGEPDSTPDIGSFSVIAEVSGDYHMQYRSSSWEQYEFSVVAVEETQVLLRIKGRGRPGYPAGLYTVAPYVQPSTGWQPSGPDLEVMLATSKTYWLPDEAPNFRVYVRNISADEVSVPHLIHSNVYINDQPYVPWIIFDTDPIAIPAGESHEWGQVSLQSGEPGMWRQVLDGRNLGGALEWNPGQYRIRISCGPIKTAELEITIVAPEGR